MVAGRLYGDIIYWGTLLAAFVCLAGLAMSLALGLNLAHMESQFAALWQGQDMAAIWHAGGLEKPSGHWYLKALHTGDGLAMAGIALGVFSVLPALALSGVYLWRDRKRRYAIFAWLAAFIIFAAMVGWIQVPA